MLKFYISDKQLVGKLYGWLAGKVLMGELHFNMDKYQGNTMVTPSRTFWHEFYTPCYV